MCCFPGSSGRSLKRFAVPAFLSIACVRGFLLNFGVYYATRAALGVGFVWSPPHHVGVMFPLSCQFCTSASISMCQQCHLS